MPHTQIASGELLWRKEKQEEESGSEKPSRSTSRTLGCFHRSYDSDEEEDRDEGLCCAWAL